MKIKCPTEAEEAVQLMQWALMHPICKNILIAIPNGGSRNFLEARNMKKQGVKAGVSDYFLPYPVGCKAGLWIELKRRDKKLSKLSDLQFAWLTQMHKVGYACCVAYGAEDAISRISGYLNGEFKCHLEK